MFRQERFTLHRQVNTLQDSRWADNESTPDTSMLEDDQQANRARVRELSLGAMLVQTAWMRVERVLKAKPRVVGQLMDLSNGDFVDRFCAPPNKDMDGWRGPAKVVDCTPETIADGIIHVGWGGRVLICRLQDIKKHTAFRTFIYLAFPDEWDVIREFINTIGRQTLPVGWLVSVQGWIVSKGARDHPDINSQRHPDR